MSRSHVTTQSRTLYPQIEKPVMLVRRCASSSIVTALSSLTTPGRVHGSALHALGTLSCALPRFASMGAPRSKAFRDLTHIWSTFTNSKHQTPLLRVMNHHIMQALCRQEYACCLCLSAMLSLLTLSALPVPSARAMLFCSYDVAMDGACLRVWCTCPCEIVWLLST
jgi:hypothetical protein